MDISDLFLRFYRLDFFRTLRRQFEIWVWRFFCSSELRKNSSDLSFDSSEVSFDSSEEILLAYVDIFYFPRSYFGKPSEESK